MKINIKIKLKNILLITALFFLSLCMCDFIVRDKNETDRDLLELERVWQYLKGYSIYQDTTRVPSEQKALSFDNPYNLVRGVNDTLHSSWDKNAYYYGNYYENWEDLAKHLNILDDVRSEKNASSTVFFSRLSDGTVYIHIPTFGSKTFEEISGLTDKVQKFPNIILDLRNNGGGYIDICKYIIELFLPQGKEYLRELKRENGVSIDKVLSTVQADDHKVFSGLENKNITVLINRYSASASEILLCALKDGLPKRVSIVGERSYGKAIGQYVFFFNTTSGAGLKLTGFRFNRIGNNQNYHEVGFLPDIDKTDWVNNVNCQDSLLIFAGKQFEPNFEQNVNVSLMVRVIAHMKLIFTRNVFEEGLRRESPVMGCFKIIDVNDLH